MGLAPDFVAISSVRSAQCMQENECIEEEKQTIVSGELLLTQNLNADVDVNVNV